MTGAVSRTVLLGVAAFAIAISAARADDAVRAAIAAAGDADTRDADAVVVLDYEDVRVRPNGIGTARQQRVVKILRPAAIANLTIQRFPFDPHTNRLELKAIRVYRADGTLEELPLDDRSRQPQQAWGIFWPSDQYLIVVPNLAVGDAVETVSEMTGFNVAYLARGQGAGVGQRNAYGEVLEPPVPGHWHDEVHFWTTQYPVDEMRYSVTLPRTMPLQFEMYNGSVQPAVTFEDDHIRYAFKMADLEPLSGEPRMEPWPNVAPKLLLATLPTWEEKSKWLYEVSEPTFQADDAIRRKVAEITSGLESKEAIYTALNKWVAENVRYAGTSRGMCEGYTNHNTIETFHDRCGVCKDKAGMLVTMLREAGFESYLVMTMARQRVDPIPADQFNHAVTCIRWPNGDLKLLDPTWMPDSRDNWSTLEPDQHVVYGLPEGKGLSVGPYFSPEECQATWRGQSRLSADNDLQTTIQFEAVGAPEGRLRRSLNSLPDEKRQGYFHAAAQRLAPQATVERVTHVEGEDYSQPLAIDLEVSADDFALGGGGRRYFKLPMMQAVFGDRVLYDLEGGVSLDERKYGVTLLASRRALIQETITLPAGWNAVELPEAVSLDGSVASLDFEITAEGNQLHYTCDLQVKKWLIEPDAYDNFKEVIDRFKELAGPVVVCETEDRHAQR
jgi:hypothetical protein